jgi:DNA-binding transcriptional regulator YiaG
MNKMRWTPNKIKKLRTALELTQAAFAKHLGITTNYVYLLEAGRKSPSETLMKLLECVELM